MPKPAAAEPTEFLTPQQLAKLCQVPLATVYRCNYLGTGPGGQGPQPLCPRSGVIC